MIVICGAFQDRKLDGRRGMKMILENYPFPYPVLAAINSLSNTVVTIPFIPSILIT